MEVFAVSCLSWILRDRRIEASPLALKHHCMERRRERILLERLRDEKDGYGWGGEVGEFQGFGEPATIKTRGNCGARVSASAD